MTVSVELIQPPADSLLNDESLAARLRRLSESPRVRVEILGSSHEGRPIWGVLIGQPEALDRLPHYLSLNRRVSGPRVIHHTLNDVAVTAEDPLALAAGEKVTVMVAGASFGFEAAHVEALIEFAEHLAASGDPETMRVLERLLVVIIPLMNPDGRAAAIRDWQREPLSVGHQGSGNAYGFFINRDFFNLSQPETRAVRCALNRYLPAAVYDPHEDMFYLSHTLPQVCWTPPFARPYHPEIDPRVIASIAKLGGAVAAEWKRQGFNFLYHPNGEHEFLTLFRLGGRLHLLQCLQGVPAFITESARMPGAQTWRDRVAQKVTAAAAFLREVAVHRDTYVGTRYAVRSDLGDPDAFVLPDARNSPLTANDVLAPLSQHGILVYRTKDPEPAFVIPTNQPDGHLVRALLTDAPWNHAALSPMAGTVCVRVSALPPGEQERWRGTKLEPVDDLGRGSLHGSLTPPRSSMVAVQSEVEGIAIANRLLDRGTPVFRLRDGEIGFVAKPRDLATRVVPRLPIRVMEADDADVLRPLRRPVTAIYEGQGVDQRHHQLEGGIRYAMEQMGFPYVRITADEIVDGGLEGIGLLIIPGGFADEIMHGSREPGQPWRPPAHSKGLGDGGLRTIRTFVEAGGGYVGIGSGGGVLASNGYLGIVDAVLEDELLGETIAHCEILKDHPLVEGLGFAVDTAGSEIRSRILVPYYSEPYSDLHGGPILRPGPGAVVVAQYAGVSDPKSLRRPECLEASSKTPAILFQHRGSGVAVILTFEPGLRGTWRSTMPILANAVFFAATHSGSRSHTEAMR